MKWQSILISGLLASQAVWADIPLSEELARERGMKTGNLALLGQSKTAPIKPQIKACGNDASKDKQQETAWSLAGNDTLKPDSASSVAGMKQTLIEVSRMAADLRYKASQDQGRKKKSCNVNILD